MDYQKLILVGNAASDVEVKESKNGGPYGTFSLGVSNPRGESTFYSIVLFDRVAEAASQVIAKGTRVLVEGSLDPVELENGTLFKVLCTAFRKL